MNHPIETKELGTRKELGVRWPGRC